MKKFHIYGVLLVCWCFSESAHAHLVNARFGEFYSGLLHPLVSFIHLVPWLALGLFAGLQPASHNRRVLWLFPLAVIAGVVCSNFLPDGQWLTGVNASSFILLGGLLVFATRLPLNGFVALVIAVGFLHGLANGLIGDTWFKRCLFAFGVASAAYALVTFTTTAGYFLQQQPRWGTIALRAGGSWVLAIGVLFIAFSVLGLGSV